MLKMKKYLSFGGGVNSVAMHIMLLSQSDDFEAIFVNHGADYPETYEYFNMFQDWLDKRGYQKITVLKPKGGNLYEYCWDHKMVPAIYPRWCTKRFKLDAIMAYVEKPCFMLIGIDASESKRVKISIENGIENRWPLIENDIDREGCKAIIEKAGLPLPMKSGCYICPFQRPEQWKQLRRNHPCLFKKAVDLEQRNMEYRREMGKPAMTLSPRKKTLPVLVGENQQPLFEIDEYPPCQCGL